MCRFPVSHRLSSLGKHVCLTGNLFLLRCQLICISLPAACYHIGRRLMDIQFLRAAIFLPANFTCVLRIYHYHRHPMVKPCVLQCLFVSMIIEYMEHSIRSPAFLFIRCRLSYLCSSKIQIFNDNILTTAFCVFYDIRNYIPDFHLGSIPGSMIFQIVMFLMDQVPAFVRLRQFNEAVIIIQTNGSVPANCPAAFKRLSALLSTCPAYRNSVSSLS